MARAGSRCISSSAETISGRGATAGGVRHVAALLHEIRDHPLGQAAGSHRVHGRAPGAVPDDRLDGRVEVGRVLLHMHR